MLLGLLVLALASCSNSELPSGPPQKLTIARILQPSGALVHVAEARGYLKEAGLDVTFRSFALGKDALDSVIAGEAEVAIVFQTPVVKQILEGQPLGILSGIFRSSRNTKLIARVDRGIATPADLVGKRIGVTKGTTTEYFLSLLLATEGIPAERVALIDVAPSRYDEALQQGEVDALVLFSPHLGRIMASMGTKAIAFHTDAYVDIAMLVAMQKTISDRSETMTRLMSALTRAENYIRSNREDSIRIVISMLAGIAGEAEIREVWDEFIFSARLDNVILSSMKGEAQWYASNGKPSMVTQDFDKAIMAAPLLAAQPQAVTVRTSASVRPH